MKVRSNKFGLADKKLRMMQFARLWAFVTISFICSDDDKSLVKVTPSFDFRVR